MMIIQFSVVVSLNIGFFCLGSSVCDFLWTSTVMFIDDKYA
jgi:hypothetical protein